MVELTRGIRNVPDDPDLAVKAGKRLCEELLEPLHATFGHVTIRSAYRSIAVNDLGNFKQLNRSIPDSRNCESPDRVRNRTPARFRARLRRHDALR